MVRKFMMTTVWRITQTGPILSLFFWSTTLAGIFWPIVGITGTGALGPLGQFLRENLGIPLDRITIVGLILLFVIFAAFILTFGYVYDRVLHLWREQMEVTYERNPYAEDVFYVKEQTQWKEYFLPLAKAMYKASPDPELKAAIERVETWVATGKVSRKE